MIDDAKICLWYDGTAAAAAHFYADTFPNSSVDSVLYAPGDYPAGRRGDLLLVEFTVCGISCIGLNGGPGVEHSFAFSFQVLTEDQAETDRLWDAIIANGGEPNACGWCRDRWGVSWQITPRCLIDAISSDDAGVAARAYAAMMDMTKIDIAALRKAIDVD